jgi:hypothetical protein
MTARAALRFVVAAFVGGCQTFGTAPASLEGVYVLVEENGRPLPADSHGCCITLSGSLVFRENTYELRTTHRNKINGIVSENGESGTFVLDGRETVFTRTAGSGVGPPYLLAPGRVSEDGSAVTILYGDEGPGSDQTEAVFRR